MTASRAEAVLTNDPAIPHRAAAPRDGMPSVVVEREHLRDALARLRDSGEFETATFVTAIDRSPGTPRFEVVHQLLSLAHGDRVRVTTLLEENDAHVPTCVDLWPGAAYMERECFDMFGVVFDGHEPLRRLLMPDAFPHHPLRKDFPHQGIEPDRLYREWDRARRAEATP